MRPYPPEIRDFIRENVAGRSARQLAKMTNDRFGTAFTDSSMKAYKQNHKLRSGTPRGTPKGAPTKLFPAEVRAYIGANHRGVGPTEVTLRLNEAFGAAYTCGQLKAYYHNNGISSGLTGRFEPGHVHFNKGRKGWSAPGTEATRFKAGDLPCTTKAIGWERKRTDGYVYVKVRMRPSRPDCNDNFVAKHRLIWEEAHGPIPDGHVVIFKDGDTGNFRPGQSGSGLQGREPDPQPPPAAVNRPGADGGGDRSGEGPRGGVQAAEEKGGSNVSSSYKAAFLTFVRVLVDETTEAEPLTKAQIRRRCEEMGFPVAAHAFDAHLREMREAGIIIKRRRAEDRNGVEYYYWYADGWI